MGELVLKWLDSFQQKTRHLSVEEYQELLKDLKMAFDDEIYIRIGA